MSDRPSFGPRILLVEDNESVFTLLSPHAQLEGFRLDWVDDGDKGLETALSSSFDLLLLDIQLPGIGGVEICRRVRAAKPGIAIIMLTSLSSEIDKVVALDAGADDYVTKPFGVHELLARIRARLRNSAPTATSGVGNKLGEGKVIRIGELEIDPLRRQLKKAGALIELTALEFDVIFLLASEPGRAFHREVLLRDVWGLEAEGYEENVSQVIRRIRRKIEVNPEEPRYLLTVRGVGYSFSEGPEIKA